MDSSVTDPSATISPSQITSHYGPSEGPLTPAPSSTRAETPDTSHGLDDDDDDDDDDDGEEPSSRKKRKSWGQAIPEFAKVLPPGKRAKTDVEKEQRRCERIMRNRKAAATSRDRKKREFEQMELAVREKDEELSRIRAQAQSQMQAILAVAFPDGKLPPSLAHLDINFSKPSFPPTPTFSPIDDASCDPMIRHSSPSPTVVSLPNHKQSSPTFTQSLFVKQEHPTLESIYSHDTPNSFEDLPDLTSQSFPDDKLDSFVTNAIADPHPVLETFTNLEDSGLTQYPAEVLCSDQQCQPESRVASRLGVPTWVQSILVIQLMVASAMSNTSSKATTWLMSHILSSLEKIWPQALSCPKAMDMIFPLIHSLICLPSTATSSRRAFRMAFLRKLLSRSPASARHLDDATARALQRLSSAESVRESHRDGITWASLMTIRWAIRSIEREDEVYRKRLKLALAMKVTKEEVRRNSGSVSYAGALGGKFHGPDDRAVCTPGPDVH